MPRAKPADKLRKLEAQRARINAESQAARRRETRRKILAGRMVLAQVAAGQVSPAQLTADMDRFLERAQDRALFGLPPRQADAEPGPCSAPAPGRPPCA